MEGRVEWSCLVSFRVFGVLINAQLLLPGWPCVTEGSAQEQVRAVHRTCSTVGYVSKWRLASLLAMLKSVEIEVP